MAFLTKQGWRLLILPTSLCACVMKAKYYTRGSFWTACIGYRPSYFWRSVVQAYYILHEGVGQRIGNGESVDMWQDKWIYGVLRMKPLI